MLSTPSPCSHSTGIYARICTYQNQCLELPDFVLISVQNFMGREEKANSPFNTTPSGQVLRLKMKKKIFK